MQKTEWSEDSVYLLSWKWLILSNSALITSRLVQLVNGKYHLGQHWGLTPHSVHYMVGPMLWPWYLCCTFVLCCQGHHSNSDISHNPDMRVLVPWCHQVTQKYGLSVFCCQGLAFSRWHQQGNPDVMSSPVDQVSCQRSPSHYHQGIALHDQLNDGYMWLVDVVWILWITMVAHSDNT